EDHGGIVAARFSRDGGTLVTIGIDGAISVRDPHTWAFRRTLAGGVSGDDPIDQGLYLSAHGEYLLTTRDGQPRLWHLPSSTLIGTFPRKPGTAVAGQDLGDQLVLATVDGDAVHVWNLDVATWPAIACRAAGRNLSAREWAQFGPRGAPYRSTCPEWPAAS
ncbi:MAG: hypothetical protein AB7W59_13535, partial [Acidimicrobiia bacterium]